MNDQEIIRYKKIDDICRSDQSAVDIFNFLIIILYALFFIRILNKGIRNFLAYTISYRL